MADICFNSRAFVAQWFVNFQKLQLHVSNVSNLTKSNLKSFSQQSLKDVLGDFSDALTKHRIEVVRHFCQHSLMLLVPANTFVKANEGKTFLWFMQEISTDPSLLLYRLFHCVSREFGHVSTDWPDSDYLNSDMVTTFGLSSPQETSPATKLLDTFLAANVNVAFYPGAQLLQLETAGDKVKDIVAKIMR